MRLNRYLITKEEELISELELSERMKPVKDTSDFGKMGRKFEHVFMDACMMVGLDFHKNGFKGRVWDIHPVGKGWEKILSDENVNIKTGGTKWMFSSSELYKMLPWEKKPKDFDEKKAAAQVKRLLNKLGVANTVFLKPKSGKIQTAISNAVRDGDKKKLEELMVKKNFYAEKLGKGYNVRVLSDKERVTSIAIDKGGHVFMRSEKPRAIGAGQGTVTVTFRTPTKKIGQDEKRVKQP